MKLKKITALALCLIMMVSLLTACVAKPYEEWFALLDKISQLERGDFEETIQITIPKELSKNFFLNTLGAQVDDLEKDIEITAELNGSMNLPEKEMYFDIKYQYEDTTMNPLTTMYMKDSTIYINMVSLINAIEKITDEDMSDARNQLKEVLGDSEYIKSTITDLSGMDIDVWDYAKPDENSNINKLSEIMNKGFKKLIQEGEFVVKEDNIYNLEINNTNVKTFANGMIDYTEENFDEIFNIVEALAEEEKYNVEMYGTKEEALSEIASGQEELNTELEKLPEFRIGLGLGYDKKSKEYKTNGYIIIDNTISIVEGAKITNNTVSEIVIPKAVDYDELYNYDNIYSEPEYPMNEEYDYISRNEFAEIEYESENVDGFTYNTVEIPEVDEKFNSVAINFPENRYFNQYLKELKVFDEKELETAKNEFKSLTENLGSYSDATSNQTVIYEASDYYDDSYVRAKAQIDLSEEDERFIYTDISIGIYNDNYQELVDKFTDISNKFGYEFNKDKFTQLIDYLYQNRKTIYENDNYFSREYYDDEFQFQVSIYEGFDGDIILTANVGDTLYEY